MDKGASATFTFTGTAVKWIGVRDAWSGIANVYIDGVLKTQIDDYAANDQPKFVLYALTGMNAGTHTITIEVTGKENRLSHASWVWVDAFDYLS